MANSQYVSLSNDWIWNHIFMANTNLSSCFHLSENRSSQYINWLVAWNMDLIFPKSLDDDPIWRTPSFFREVGWNHSQRVSHINHHYINPIKPHIKHHWITINNSLIIKPPFSYGFPIGLRLNWKFLSNFLDPRETLLDVPLKLPIFFGSFGHVCEFPCVSLCGHFGAFRYCWLLEYEIFFCDYNLYNYIT
jgi:hypothetical protein